MNWRFWRKPATEPRITLKELRKQELAEWDRQFAMLTGHIPSKAQLGTDFANDLVRAIRYQMLDHRKTKCELCSEPVITEQDQVKRDQILTHRANGQWWGVRVSDFAMKNDIDALWKAKDDLCLRAHAA